MARDIRLLTEYAGILRSFAWISLLDDGSVSIGFLDKNFAVPALGSEIEVDGIMYQQVIDLEASCGKEAISNPHFTFHPAAYYHLRANRKKELFAGLLMVDLVVESEGVLPWIRLVSNPVKRLEKFIAAPSGRRVEIFRLQLENEEPSIAIEVDFVNESAQTNSFARDLYLNWFDRIIRIRIFHVDPQKATLWWNHSS